MDYKLWIWLLVILSVVVLLAFVGYKVKNPSAPKTSVYSSGNFLGNFAL